MRESLWDEAVASLRGKEFFGGPVGATQDGAEVVLAVDKAQTSAIVLRFVAGLCCAIVTGLWLVAGSWGDSASYGLIVRLVGWVAVGVGAGLSVVFLAQLYWVCHAPRRIRLASHPPRITAVLGGQEFTVPVSEVKARLMRLPEITKGHPDFAGGRGAPKKPDWNAVCPFRLELYREAADGTESVLCLVNSTTREQILPALTSLRAIVPVADDTLHRVMLRDGEAFVDTAVLTNRPANFTARTLTERSESLVEIHAAQESRRKQAGWIAFWVAFLAVMAASKYDTKATELIADACLAGFWIVVNVLILKGIIGPKPMRIDLSRGVITMLHGCPHVSALSTGLPVERLAALQLCAKACVGPRGGVMAYELNALLRGEAGGRFTLLENRDRHRVEQEAARLAAMLNLPRIDNTNGHQVVDDPTHQLPPVRFATPQQPPLPMSAFS
ncbi:MAG: hypothetical protein FWE88_08230 [Phycisphaerae bacterium]|nr:hypothetical protein [Phycisphaerae bacterium]